MLKNKSLFVFLILLMCPALQSNSPEQPIESSRPSKQLTLKQKRIIAATITGGILFDLVLIWALSYKQIMVWYKKSAVRTWEDYYDLHTHYRDLSTNAVLNRLEKCINRTYQNSPTERQRIEQLIQSAQTREELFALKKKYEDYIHFNMRTWLMKMGHNPQTWEEYNALRKQSEYAEGFDAWERLKREFNRPSDQEKIRINGLIDNATTLEELERLRATYDGNCNFDFFDWVLAVSKWNDAHPGENQLYNSHYSFKKRQELGIQIRACTTRRALVDLRRAHDGDVNWNLKEEEMMWSQFDHAEIGQYVMQREGNRPCD